MFHHLVVAIDGSEHSLQALDYAIGFAEHLDSSLDIVSVIETLPPYVSRADEANAAEKDARTYYSRLHLDGTRRAARRGVSANCQILVGHELGATIEYLRDTRADLLVIGARGHSAIWNAFLGSTADQLVEHAPTSVLVVHGAAGGQVPKELIVGLDGSPSSTRALMVAVDLCRAFRGIVHGVTVIEGGRDDAQSRWKAYVAAIQARAQALADAGGIRFEVHTERGHAGENLLRAAQDLHADLLIIGSAGLERPWNVTTTATARTVANQARCSVLIVRSTAYVQTVEDVMSRPVTTTRPDEPLEKVIDLLFRRGVKALPVVNSQEEVVGIVTGGDLLRRGGLQLRLSVHSDLRPGEFAQLLGHIAEKGRTVSAIMTSNPRTVSADAPVGEVIRDMSRKGIKRLPVVDVNGKLCGIVSRTDLLRAVVANSEQEEQGVRIQASVRTVTDVTLRDVPTVQPADPIEDALGLIVGSPFRRVVVIDSERKVLGVITERSLVSSLNADDRQRLLVRLSGRLISVFGADRQPLTAESVMEREVFTILTTASLREALKQMLDRRVKRLIVVDENGRLIGIIDRKLILSTLVRLGYEVGIIKSDETQ